ncbi:DEAD/DEAH box helicase, partial [bacterium]
MKLSEIKFSDLDLLPELHKAVASQKFEYLTEVQAMTIPTTLTGKDLAVQAQTGSGKTAAFLVTIFDRLLKVPKKKTHGVCPRAIVIT